MPNTYARYRTADILIGLKVQNPLISQEDGWMLQAFSKLVSESDSQEVYGCEALIEAKADREAGCLILERFEENGIIKHVPTEDSPNLQPYMQIFQPTELGHEVIRLFAKQS